MVLDARGPAPQSSADGHAGYQMFFGMEVELEHEGELSRPVLMGTPPCPSWTGIASMYLLPLGSRRWLVEDTYYRNEPRLETATARSRIERF